MRDSGSANDRWESHQKRRYKKYPKHVHFDQDEECVSPCDENPSYLKLPSFDPAEVTSLQGQQIQNTDLFPFSFEENSEDEAFFAAFNDSGDEGTHLRELDRAGFNDIISCPSLARQNKSLPNETFEQRAKKRGRDSGALQLALRLFCRNYEQHYGSLIEQRLVDFPPTLASSNANLESKESTRRDALQCTKLNGLFRAEQFEYEKAKPSGSSITLEKQSENEEQHFPIIDPSAWSGVRNANKEIEGILLQRLLWKVLVMASKRIEQGNDDRPKSLEEQFVQKQWDSVVASREDESQHRSDIQDLVFEYITCLLGENYHLGPNFSGRIYDYSVDPGSIRMLDSLTSADQPTSIQSTLREETLCPIAMRILYLFSETSDNKANEKQRARTAEKNETIPPSEERVKHFKKQRDFLRKTTPSWKSKGKYLSFKDAVKPVRERLSVDEAVPDAKFMSTMLTAENSRDPKHYDLDYDQIWAFSRELPTYTKVRNYFSLKFYDGVLREDVDDPWDEEGEYGYDAQMADLREKYDLLPLGANDNPDTGIPYIRPPKPPTRAEVWSNESSDNNPCAEVGSGQIMPLPLIDFDPEKLQAEQMAKVKKWRIPKYYPGDSGKFPLPETGFIEAVIGAQIQKDLDDWQSKNNNSKNGSEQVVAEDVTTREKFKLPNPKPIWTKAPNYPVKVISRGTGRGRQAVPLIPLDSPQSTAQPTMSTRSAPEAGRWKRSSRKEYKRAAAIKKARVRQAADTQLQGEEGRVAPTTTKPSPKPTVSVEKRHEKSLRIYKPLPLEKLAKAHMRRQREKKGQDSSSARKPTQAGHQLFETTPAAKTKTTTEPQTSSPRPRIVGTGYHHLPARDNLFPTSATPTQMSYRRRIPVPEWLKPKATDSPPQRNPLYPWLPLSKPEEQRDIIKAWAARRKAAEGVSESANNLPCSCRR